MPFPDTYDGERVNRPLTPTTGSLLVGLEHRYAMDESSGLRQDTLNPGSGDAWTANGTVVAGEGKNGNAVAIDASKYLSIDTATLFPSTTFTVIFWMNASTYFDFSGLSGSPILVSNTASHGIDIYRAPSSTDIVYAIYPTGTVTVPGDALPINGWHIVIAWFDDATNVGGIQIDDGSAFTFSGGSFSRSSGSMFVGFNSAVAGFTGRADELLVYSRVLGVAERAALVAELFYPFIE